MSNINLTNYEMNKQAYASENFKIDPNITERLYNAAYDFDSRCCKYVGLLCRERNDYTVFKLSKNKNKFASDLWGVLEYRGEILDVLRDKNDMSDTYQFWVRERRSDLITDLEKNPNFKWTPQVWMYMLFDASDWVIEVED